jgi:putative transposase
MTTVTSESEVAEAAVPGAASAGLDVLDRELVGQLVAQARAGELKLTGEGSLLAELTRRVLESALEGEMTDHLGRGRHEVAGGDEAPNHRNGHRTKTVTTEVGPVEVSVPRDREGTFEPQLVRKRQRRLSGVDEMVLSLSAKGLTHGEISAHLREVYGTEVSKQTISTITDSVVAGMTEWRCQVGGGPVGVVWIGTCVPGVSAVVQVGVDTPVTWFHTVKRSVISCR